VAAERLAGPQRGLEVHLGACGEPTQRRARKRLGDGVERDAPVGDVGRGEADAVDGDRVAQPRGPRDGRRLDEEAYPLGVSVDGRDAATLPHDAREHGAKASPS